ncbi:multi-sensor signal transduction histidine kinase [Haloterrigena turkmenica DSM 5511]|uniref:histidine kinase n=1 Tax=Haloterrigena turkmenica (strain ATCC 51198 / DSM 5511 / JCM 9101 / NCIMB 13204 / VKM B-1734 / 4k) TaxID=543526 RepID=D2RW42_HALTV|nr:MEDS domain-containing protein [Haloterrigena turkmenica]ADB61471.1 multi-sensor signal transduction histidine kinase [Haloterrigena turkmenica DSM 5511]
MSNQLSDQTDQRTAPDLGGRFTPSKSRSALRGPVEPLDGHEDTDHLALLYEDRAEQFEAVVPFIRDGLERGERCVYVADDNTTDEVLDAMRARDVDVDAALESGALSVHTEAETYRRTGEFDREAMLSFWEETLADATADEFTGLRAAAEMTWALETDADFDGLCEYEALLNPHYEGEDYTVLCQYNRDRFPADVVHDVLKTHPYLVYDGTICQNLYYTPPEEYFGPDRVSREIDRKLETLVDRTDARLTIETSEHYQREVYEIMSDANRSFDEKLDALFEVGCERFDLDLGGLARVDPESDLFEVEAVSGEHDHLVPGARLDLSETYCRVVADSDAGSDDDIPDPVEITDPVDSGFENAACFAEFDVRTYLGTRIPVDGDHDRTFFFVTEESRDASISEEERTFHRLMGQWVKYELERQQRERELRERTEHLNALIETTPECIKTVAPDGTLLQMNPAGLDMVEADAASDVVGECVYDLIAPEDRERFREFNERICRGERGTLEFDIIGLEGTRRQMESHAESLQRPDGTTVHVALTRDITEQKERQQALQESKNQLQALIDVLPVAVFVAEGDGQIVEWNEAAEEIWGGEVAESDSVAEYEAYDGWWADTGEPVDPDEWALARALRGEEVVDPDEIEIEGFDGERRTVLNHGMPVRDEAGEVRRAVVTLVDITERKEREAELRQTKDRFETVFEQSDDGIFVIDPETDAYVDANSAACEMTGYTRDELSSIAPSDLHPDELEQFRAFLDEVRETGSAWTEDLHCRRKNGHDISAEIAASSITLDGRELVLASVRNIEQRKKHERYQRDLYEITADPDLSFDEKLERLLELGRDRFGLEMGGLNHLPSWDGAFRLEKGVGLGLDPDEELWTDPDSNCFCRRTISEEDPVEMADVRGTHWTEDTIYREFGMTSYLGTKVTSGSTPYGTLWFGSTDPRDNPFSAAERSFIELMGQWVSYEIERREHNESQRELYDITANVDLAADEKIDRLLKVGCDRLNLPVGMLTRERTNAFEIEHMHGSHPDLDEGTLTPPLTDNYSRRVVDTGDSISVADAGAAGWDGDALYHEFDLRCYAGTQVIVDDDVYGTVCFTDTVPREEFTETERSFLDLLGQCIGYELERQQYERELEETVDRLQQSNERLEHFAYAASHDLQEPLRMVTSYLQLLESRYGDAFDEDGEEFLEFAVDGADRMREMIDGLLAYSRVETRGDPFEPVELDTVLDEVLTDLQIEIEETDAEITTAELPRVEGDESQLRQLLQNLLDNALTYSGDEPPRIHIDAEPRRQKYVISVRDDGIGIEPGDQDRIFTVFDRLHSRDEYDGTGLGLALCQRIVERHGGDIWVDSEPSEGSTFSFTLPAA